ncbi:MAG: DUF222 domain-containing protein [Nocardioides sp.]|nr:DUF222 domain-containing protein [Nocardioides sp.]
MAATVTTREVTREEQVIAAARATRDAMTGLEVELLLHAVEWVRLHPGEEVDTSVEWGMRELEIAGDGAPTIDEGAVAEFALAIGHSTDSGRRYLGDAVELAYRLPRIWKRVLAGEVAVWKARRIAQATASLPPQGAAAVDRALYFVARRCSYAEIDRQVEKARKEHDLLETERRRVEAMEKRHVDVHLGAMTYDGLVPITAMADVPDAVAFEDYLATEAAGMDPTIPLQVRRSMVLGMLGGRHGDTGEEGSAPGVMVFVHTRPGQAMVDVDNTRSTTTVEQVQEWCTRAGTKVTIRPVIDLAEEMTTDAYTPTERMVEQVKLRFAECPFPGCHRPSRPGYRAKRRKKQTGEQQQEQQHGSDLDHRQEWPEGKTTSSNLFPPCRGHHRLKTFTDWTYDYDPATGFTWTSPQGYRYTDPGSHPGSRRHTG